MIIKSTKTHRESLMKAFLEAQNILDELCEAGIGVGTLHLGTLALEDDSRGYAHVSVFPRGKAGSQRAADIILGQPDRHECAELAAEGTRDGVTISVFYDDSEAS